MDPLNRIVACLIHPDASGILPIRLQNPAGDAEQSGRDLNQALLILLAGPSHPDFSRARRILNQDQRSAENASFARFYRQGLSLIEAELRNCIGANPQLEIQFKHIAERLTDAPAKRSELAELFWSVLFPEGTGINGLTQERIAGLRARRTVRLTRLNPDPITRPAGQILFTSNVLLTTPLPGADLSEFDPAFTDRIRCAEKESQSYWYDHPIPIGIEDRANEILYGLKHLNQAAAIEHERRGGALRRVNCVLSVSVTHNGLHALAKDYLKLVLAKSGSLDHLRIFAFTEQDTLDLIRKVLLPAARHCPQAENAEELLTVFGVDGRYGRHYSFLKAIAAVWQVLIDPAIRATFKIDLDQVFPQEELIHQTGASAFEHLQTPLWGASGMDDSGRPVELGMIAGALVNQSDIGQGLFTPDVTFPESELQAEDFVFYSRLPQALSTQAEMMTQYRGGTLLDGQNHCLQRIHVTGGTNGILVDSLRRHRPFTPSFIARAEDQAYLMSVANRATRLAYAHAAGLIMRHDKQGFAGESIAAAEIGKQIGDYCRMLMFSSYAQTLPCGVAGIKQFADPFTGCFISLLPTTVTLVRFAINVETQFHRGAADRARSLLGTGIPQLTETLEFISGQPNELEQTYLRERQGWQLFYDSLTAIEKSLGENESWALALRSAASKIVDDCLVN